MQVPLVAAGGMFPYQWCVSAPAVHCSTSSESSICAYILPPTLLCNVKSNYLSLISDRLVTSTTRYPIDLSWVFKTVNPTHLVRFPILSVPDPVLMSSRLF